MAGERAAESPCMIQEHLGKPKRSPRKRGMSLLLIPLCVDYSFYHLLFVVSLMDRLDSFIRHTSTLSNIHHQSPSHKLFVIFVMPLFFGFCI